MFSNDVDLFSVFQFDAPIDHAPPERGEPSEFHYYLTNALYDGKTGPLQSYLNQIFISYPVEECHIHDFIRWALSPPLTNVPYTQAAEFLERMTESANCVEQFYFAARCAFAKALILTNHCWKNQEWKIAAEAWKNTFSLYLQSNLQGLNPHVSQKGFLDELELGYPRTWSIIFRDDPLKFDFLLKEIWEVSLHNCSSTLTLRL